MNRFLGTFPWISDLLMNIKQQDLVVVEFVKSLSGQGRESRRDGITPDFSGVCKPPTNTRT